MPDHTSDEQRVWEQGRSHAITSDVIWKLDAYRASLFLLHCVRIDCRTLRITRTGEETAAQLVRAAGSVSANIGEGYSRSGRKDRLRFLDYALGSARECFTWYETGRDILPEDVIEMRQQLAARLRSLLLGLIRSLRRST
jgi:four helix bundle protein